MSELVRTITAAEPELRDRALDAICQTASTEQLLDECAALEHFRHSNANLYERVRALTYLAAIHRYHLPLREGIAETGHIDIAGHQHLLERRFEEAIRCFLRAQTDAGPSRAVSSALAAAYRGLAFQTLADQVRRAVREVPGNQWMFRAGHTSDYPLQLRRELLETDSARALMPVLREATPVRMDLSHSAWSDIFYLGMDAPEAARVLNISVDLSTPGSSNTTPRPPVEVALRVIDEPVLRLTSVDLGTSADVTSIAEVFDFSRDYLGLLKAGLIAAGIVPPALEASREPLESLLARLTRRAGHGIELITEVHGIPRGSRLAVSTTLLASIISVAMRATGQIRALSGGLDEADRRLVAARAILGEWLGGSGGGWQDSGGVWPGIKLIEGVRATENDREWGRSRGCLVPRHRLLSFDDVSPATRQALERSLVLVHGGMAQDVGPILEMVSERYLLRSAPEWHARQEARRLLDEIIDCLRRGDIRALGACTQRNYDGPIQTIVPWAGNLYTRTLIERVRERYGTAFWGFWMLGGMAGGGMGFLFDPQHRTTAASELPALMCEVKRSMERAVSFAMEPVVYDFAVNERGTWATLRTGDHALLDASYYALRVPALLRRDAHTLSPAQRIELERFGAACRTTPGLTNAPALIGMVQTVFDQMVPGAPHNEGQPGADLDTLLAQHGFDREQHEKARAELRAGRIGLAQNRLAVSTVIEDVLPDEIANALQPLPAHLARLGEEALRSGAVAVVSIAGGIGTRWTHGAGVVKALSPFVQMGGAYRNFLAIHLAKSRRTAARFGASIPHVVTTSYLTHAPIEAYVRSVEDAHAGPLYVSPGRAVGLRMVPMIRDLRFAWAEMAEQTLQERKQKARESARAALIQWACRCGEGSDYTDNVPEQCLHPMGHWYEVPNLLANGVLARMLDAHPQLRYLLVHNIDTLGANLDPALLGLHIGTGAAMSVEVIPRELDDRGGGLARVAGKLRLVEGLALPDERLEHSLSYYNSNTMWIDIERLLEAFSLTHADLHDAQRTAGAIRRVAARMPSYVTLKDVKRRWGKGQEDVFPVTQFEKLWGDMTSLAGFDCRYVVVPRQRGQQLKDVAQLDGWWRDGSADYVNSLCQWQQSARAGA